MAWQERVLEKHVKRLLESKLADEGSKLWGRYVSTRDEFIDTVIPWIATEAPDLTDHGQKHIEDVLDNGAILLGIPNEHSDDSWVDCDHGFTPHEMFIFLCGLLLHDVGNIYGRDRHNQKIGEVWSKMASWQLWTERERQLVISVGRAHAGKNTAGSPEDTIKGLDVHPQYFNKYPVRLAPIAAVIRFADELAEGTQRTSRFLIENNLIEQSSQLHHQYAQIANPAIDRAKGRIALSFTISLDNPSYPADPAELELHLCKLLKMAYSRAAKMNYERQYARHYASVLTPFRETSISLSIYSHGNSLGPTLDPILLTDFCNSNESAGLIENINAAYSIEALAKGVIGELNGQV